MKKLHEGTKWSFRFAGYFFGIFILFFAGIFISILRKSFFDLSFVWFFIAILFALVFGEVFARLYYINWKYEFTPRELKTEKGIIVKKYGSLPYERIQNVDIRRGILARILGFSTLNIQTAGYSYGGGVSEGHIPGVSVKEAEKIRKFLMDKVYGKKGSSGIN